MSDTPSVSYPLPWHDKEWALLTSQFLEDRLPHALILAGSSFIGKSRLALALSRLLLCAHPKDGFNCGDCHACQLSRVGSHGDFLWVSPEEKSRTIKIDQVRKVVQFAVKSAGYGARKVVVFDPADSMNVNAFNALLKTLEEPLPGTFLILVCHAMHKVPITVKSRCRQLLLRTPEAADSLIWLDQITGNRDDSTKCLQLADGRPLLAAQMSAGGKRQAVVAQQSGFAELLAGKMPIPEVVQLWSESEPVEVLEHFGQGLRRRLRAANRKQLISTEGRAAFGILDEIVRLQRAVSAGANPNRQLLLESLLAKIHRELGDSFLGDKI